MNPVITYRDRLTGELKVEKVYGGKALHFLYGKGLVNRVCLNFLSKFSLFSSFYGFLQRLSLTAYKIAGFIKEYEVNTSEFLDPVDSFASFDAFFTRKLKKEVRPLDQRERTAIIPCDGRFLFYQNIEDCDGFVVKGKKFSLPELVGDQKLAHEYTQASMVIARLCPADYHRFHFPFDCVPHTPRLINGFLYSVNPNALKQNIAIFTENKRIITQLDSPLFGKVLYIEIGATCVGSIHQTFTPHQQYKKGDEKGYFSFGGSSIILLFEQNRIIFDSDLTNNSSKHVETLCLMGQSLGQASYIPSSTGNESI